MSGDRVSAMIRTSVRSGVSAGSSQRVGEGLVWFWMGVGLGDCFLEKMNVFKWHICEVQHSLILHVLCPN